MKILRFLKEEAGTNGYLFLLLGLISGLANASILKFIDYIVQGIISTQNFTDINYKYILIYAGVLTVFFLTQRFFAKYLIGLTQNIILNLRLDILSRIRFSGYLNYQQIGRERIYTSLTQDTEKISAAAASVVYAMTYLVTVIFCLSYLAYVSLLGFLLTLGIIGSGIIVYSLRQKKIHSDLSKARDLQNELFKQIDDLLLGFKEMKVNKEKNEDLFNNYIKDTSLQTKNLASKAITSFLDNSLTGQIFFFLLIGFVLFYFPIMTGSSDMVLSYIFIVLYILGPLEGLMSVVPTITQADIALDRIEELKKKTESLQESDSKKINKFQDFQKITFDNVSFAYPENKGENFSVGPVNLTLNRGEMNFIVGGNGSGKTTFFKLLTGLYYPGNGKLVIDGEEVISFNEYRSLYSTIYSDFHLFDRFYGLKNINEKEVNEYLVMMQLSEKVKFENGRFNKTDLSTGQRKRLAMILSLLEKKPILVLDEWAADQDPNFRAFFYKEFLPNLKKQGKTIIAITHDDKYFSVADNVYKMEYGKFEKFIQ